MTKSKNRRKILFAHIYVKPHTFDELVALYGWPAEIVQKDLEWLIARGIVRRVVINDMDYYERVREIREKV